MKYLVIISLLLISCSKSKNTAPKKQDVKQTVDTLTFKESSSQSKVSQYVYLDTSKGIIGSSVTIQGDSAFSFILPPSMILYLDANPTNKAIVTYILDVTRRKAFDIHYE